ncbi:MAG: hypothetical protein AAGA85_12585 [Bacteroidota bacterium]
MRKPLVLILCVVSLGVFGQRKKDRDTSSLIFQPKRVEFEVGKYDEDYTIINGEDDGLMLVVQTYAKIEGKYAWQLAKLDTDLNEVWRKSVLVSLTATMLGYEYFDGKFYVLVSESQYRTQDMVVYEIDVDGNIQTFEITTVFPISLAYFEVIGETLLLGGNVNARPVIITYGLEERKPKVLPGFYDNRNEILDVVIDDEELMFTVILRERLVSKQYSVRAKTFTAEGFLVQDLLVESGERRNLIDAASTNFESGIQMLAGAHSKRSTSYSKGLYLAKFVNGRQQFIEYHNYADLENFFGFMSDKREQRIKRRIERRKQMGKKNKFNYRLIVHDMIQNDDGVNIMVGEAYYPRYTSSSGFGSPYPYGGYGGRFTGPSSSFLGFKYTHTIVVAFDNNGKIIWDHSFKIQDALTYSLQKFVSVSYFDDQIVLMYLDENEIRSKIVQGNEVIEGQTFNPVKLSNQNEEVKSKNPEIEGLDHWYDNNFYAFGLHNLTDVSKGNFWSSRKVFYINKIEYDRQRSVN